MSFSLQVVRWSQLKAQYEGEMAANTQLFGGEAGAKRADDFRLRVVEHNVLVIAKYYARVTTARLAELLDLTPEEVTSPLPFPGSPSPHSH